MHSPSLAFNELAVAAVSAAVLLTCVPAQVAALAPKIEAMEASWNRLRAISGAETPNEVVEYWQGRPLHNTSAAQQHPY